MTQTRTPMSSSFVAALSPTLSHPVGSGAARALPESSGLSRHNDQSHAATYVPARMLDLRGSANVAAWLEAVDRRLQLPNSFQAFSLAVGGLLLFVAGAFLLMLPSVQIIESQVELRQLHHDYVALEQTNNHLMFTVARETNLARLLERAVEQGFVPIGERVYVAGPTPAAVAARDHPPAIDTGAEPFTGDTAMGSSTTAALPDQPNWRSWEALLGLGSPTTVQVGTPTTAAGHGTPSRWESWWEGTLELGESRPWSDFTSRLLDQWNGR